jgi:hypothetical protein
MLALDGYEHNFEGYVRPSAMVAAEQFRAFLAMSTR